MRTCFKILLYIGVLLPVVARAQLPVKTRGDSTLINLDYRLLVGFTLGIPLYNDTASALHGGKDVLGLIVQIKTTGAWYKRDTLSGGGHQWTLVGSGAGLDTTAADIRYLKRGDSAVNNTHGFTTQASRQKLADSLQAVFNAMLSLKLNSSDSAATNPHGYVTQASRQKLSDSLQAVFNALLAGKVTNAGGVSFFGRGTYASKPTTGTGIWYATDSASFFYINGATATNMNPTFHITVNNLSTGYPLAFGHDSTFDFWTLAPGSNVAFDTTTHGKLIINSSGGGGGSDSGISASNGIIATPSATGPTVILKGDTAFLATRARVQKPIDSLGALIGGKTDTATTDSILTRINKRAYFITGTQTGANALTYVVPIGVTDSGYVTKAIYIHSPDGSIIVDTTSTNDSAVDISLRAIGGSGGVDTNSVYSSSYMVPGQTKNAHDSLQAMWNFAAAHGKGVVITGAYVDSAELDAPTTGALNVSWTFLTGGKISYASKTGAALKWSGATFHDIVITNPQLYYIADTTSIGQNGLFFQGIGATRIHKVSIKGGVISGFSTGILRKGVHDGDIADVSFEAPTGHGTTTSSPDVCIRDIDDSVGDENRILHLHGCHASGYTGSASITTMKTLGPKDGFYYGHTSGLNIHDNTLENFAEEPIVYQPSVGYIDSLPTHIHNNIIVNNIPKGSKNPSGVAIRETYAIRAECQNCSIDDNQMFGTTNGIYSDATVWPAFTFRNMTIDGNEIWATTDTAAIPDYMIAVIGQPTHPMKGVKITNNKIHIDSTTTRGKSLKGIYGSYSDSSVINDNIITQSRLTRSGGGVHGIDLNNVTAMTLNNNTTPGVDTSLMQTAATYSAPAQVTSVDKSVTSTQTQTVNGPAYDLHVVTENSLGVISNRNSWTNTTGYTNNGAPTPTFTGSKLNFASGGSVYTSLDLDRYTVLEKFVISDTVVIGEKSGTSYGSGIGIHSYNTSAGSSQVDFVSRFVTYTAAGSGSIFMEAGPSRVNIGTSAPISFTVGDTIVERLERDGFAFTGSAQNLSTHGQPSSVTYIFKPTTDLAFMPNTGKFCIWYLGGAFQVTGMSITSKQPKNAKIGISGDSRGVGEIVTNQSARLGDQLGQNFLTVVSSGGFDRTADKLLTLPEDSALAFKQAIIWLGYNDINTGVSAATCEANLDSIAHYYTIQGMTPYFLLTSSDGAAASTRAVNSYLRTHYPSNIFDCEQLTRNAGARQVDSVHLTDYGNGLVYNFIMASGKLLGGSVAPGIRNQIATIQPAAFKISGPSAVLSQFTVGDGTDQTYQFRQWLGPNRDLWGLSAFGTNYLQSLDDTHTNGTPLNIGAYRLSLGYQTTGYGEEEWMDSAGVHIGNPTLGIRIPLQVHVAVDTSLKFFTSSGEVHIEASDTTRSATSALTFAGKYIRFDSSPTGGNEQARIGQGDTSIFQGRISYPRNINGALKVNSLAPKGYVDSVAGLGGHDSTLMATKYDVDTAKAAIRASIGAVSTPTLAQVLTAGSAGGGNRTITNTGSTTITATLGVFLGSTSDAPTKMAGATRYVKNIFSSGTSFTIPNNYTVNYIDLPTTASSASITLPSASPEDGSGAYDGQIIEIFFGGTITSGAVITSLTVNAGTGNSIIQSSSVTTANAADHLYYIYRAFSSSVGIWYRKP